MNTSTSSLHFYSLFFSSMSMCLHQMKEKIEIKNYSQKKKTIMHQRWVQIPCLRCRKVLHKAGETCTFLLFFRCCLGLKFDKRCSQLQPHSKPPCEYNTFWCLIGVEGSLRLDHKSLKHNLSHRPLVLLFLGLVFHFIGELSVQQSNQKLLATGECNPTGGETGKLALGEEETWILMLEVFLLYTFERTKPT